MNALKAKYGDSDMFDIVGIPCNQFGLQEPGRNNETMNGIRWVRPGADFVPSFEITSKYSVNGAEVGNSEHELYTFMKGVCPGTQDIIGDTTRLYWTPVTKDDITWNYEKFLMDKQGRPYKRYAPVVLPEELEPDIEYLMSLE